MHTDHDETLLEKSQRLLRGSLNHARSATLAAALVPLGLVVATPAVAQDCGSGGCPPPSICEGSAVPPSLWPPNHSFHEVEILGTPEFEYDFVSIVGVTQDEPLDGRGDGRTRPDAMIDGGTVLIRAERAGLEQNGRVYEIHYTAGSFEGRQCEGTATVIVPHDMSEEHLVVDDGQLYDSTGG